MLTELIILIILGIGIYVYLQFFDVSGVFSGIGNNIDTILGGRKDPNFCPDESNPDSKCTTNCVAWTSLQNSADYYCYNDHGSGWKSSGIGQGLCSVGTGKAICKKDLAEIGKDYMKACVIWSDIDKNGNKFCNDDYGDGYVYTGEKNQAGCTAGFGRGICKSDETKKGHKYMKECVIWSDIDKNGNKFCNDDYGDGYVYTGEKNQAGCTAGFGRGICKSDETKKGHKYMKECVIWSEIDNNGNKFCNDDHGDGYVYTGDKEQAGCSIGYGKGLCKYDASQAGKKYFNTCAVWSAIDANANTWCRNDFGPGWVYTGEKDQGGCSGGMGRGKCKYDASKADEKYFINCAVWSAIDANANTWCRNDFGPGWVYTGEKDQGGCSGGMGRGKCKFTG